MTAIIILSFIFILVIILNTTAFWLFRKNRPFTTETLTYSQDLSYENHNPRAVLLLHEFMGTPQSMAYLGEYLSRQGWDVFIPALPGSADSEKDFRRLPPVHYRQLREGVRTYYIGLRKRYASVVIMGASLGGALSLDIAEEFSGTEYAPVGVATFGTGLKLTGNHFRKRLLRNSMLYFSGVLCLFRKEIPTSRMKEDARRREGFSGVEGFLYPSVIHTHKVNLRQVRRRLKRIACPVAVFHARDDRTVNCRNLSLITRGLIRGKTGRVFARLFDLSEDRLTRHHRIASHEWTRETVAEQISYFLTAIASHEGNKA